MAPTIVTKNVQGRDHGKTRSTGAFLRSGLGLHDVLRAHSARHFGPESATTVNELLDPRRVDVLEARARRRHRSGGCNSLRQVPETRTGSPRATSRANATISNAAAQITGQSMTATRTTTPSGSC